MSHTSTVSKSMYYTCVLYGNLIPCTTLSNPNRHNHRIMLSIMGERERESNPADVNAGECNIHINKPIYIIPSALSGSEHNR